MVNLKILHRCKLKRERRRLIEQACKHFLPLTNPLPAIRLIAAINDRIYEIDEELNGAGPTIK